MASALYSWGAGAQTEKIQQLFMNSLFCKDTVHFSFHGNHVFTNILFNIIQYFKYRCCYYFPVINLI